LAKRLEKVLTFLIFIGNKMNEGKLSLFEPKMETAVTIKFMGISKY